MTPRKPWMKWYPSDWRADPKLRMCSLGSRGLWVDMIALMHESEPYGHLTVAGKSPTEQQIASLVGASLKSVKSHLLELEDAGVFSRTDAGVIYSRRMVRDKAKADTDAANGKRGGNPKLKKTDNRDAKGGDNPPHKAQRPEARDQKDYVEPSGSTPRPPADLKTAIFDHGLAWIAGRTGKPPDKLRPMLGKWCRDFGDASTAEAIMSAQREGAVEPIGWISKTLEARNGKRSGNQSWGRQLADAALADDTTP